MYKFAFHNALITGGSSGIGLATAQKLVEGGVNVMLVARDSERLGVAKSRLEAHAAEGAAVSVLALDVSDRKMLENVLAPLIRNGVSPDLVVNCAGMAYPNYFEQIDSEIFDKTVKINLTGTWNILKCVVPAMRSGGHIVNVSSVAGLVGTFGYTAYSATKFAIIGLSEALRNELSQKGIGVSVLCPADTDTPQLDFENRSKPAETRAISGNAGVMKPEQVAEALLAGVRKKRFLIVPGVQAKLVYLAKRFVPGLLYGIMDRDAKKSKIVSHAAVGQAKRRK
ncbi:MAG TPA: SDR family oxidoreductase [Clostridia bacterium]|nr:SDR family oxidoreductase [Clostridia bacterium]